MALNLRFYAFLSRWLTDYFGISQNFGKHKKIFLVFNIISENISVSFNGNMKDNKIIIQRNNSLEASGSEMHKTWDLNPIFLLDWIKLRTGDYGCPQAQCLSNPNILLWQILIIGYIYKYYNIWIYIQILSVQSIVY